MNDPEQLTAQQYADALQQVSDRITDKQWEMLRVHYHAPNKQITARQLADAVGFQNYGGANLQYGLLGGLLGSVLGLSSRHSSVLATGIDAGEEDNPEFLFVMRPQLAAALEQLKRT